MMQNEHALYTNYLHAFSLKLYKKYLTVEGSTV